MQNLKNEIEKLNSGSSELTDSQTRSLFNDFCQALNNGTIRAAEKKADKWEVNAWVKQGILLLFKHGKLIEMPDSGNYSFFDKDTVLLRRLTIKDEIRLVPGGSSIRNGAYLAKGIICMPPMYINIGSYIDEGTMIDSHALIGTCAQIGKHVHISAAVQIGGVLEPIGASPVIIEDNVMIGGNCGVYEGVIVEKNAVLSTGVILNSSSKVYDLVNEQILTATEKSPLIIPKGAVVVQGARAIDTNFAKEHNLSITTPLIVKYRNEKTNKKTELEKKLR